MFCLENDIFGQDVLWKIVNVISLWPSGYSIRKGSELLWQSWLPICRVESVVAPQLIFSFLSFPFFTPTPDTWHHIANLKAQIQVLGTYLLACVSGDLLGSLLP